MAKQNILTLQNLLEFCIDNNLTHYDSHENEGRLLVVHVPAKFSEEITNTFDNAQSIPEGLMPVTLQACHIDLNRNGSFISETNMMTALPSFSNRPILGHIIQKDDGSYDFDSHNMEIVEDPWNKGEQRVNYIEKPIGIIPESCNAHLEYDEEKDKTYVIVNGYIFEDYGNGAADIIREKGGTKVSVELGIKKFSFNAEKKYLEIEDFIFMGVTALGEDVGEGMIGSNLQIADFSASATYEKILLEALDNLNNILSNFQIKQENKEGGSQSVKLNELLTKYEKTPEDITFDTQGLSDEELENKFKEIFDEIKEDTPAEGPIDEPIEEPVEEPEEISPTETEAQKKKRKCSIEINGLSYNFAVSLNEKLFALENLVNATYSESDNAYYCIQAYDNYVVMVDYWTGKSYKQEYACADNSYSLTGDRVEVFARYVTADEDKALDNMRSKYSALEDKLSKYIEKEEKSKKEQIFASEEFELIKDTEEFKAIVTEAENYSSEDIQEKCDKLLLEYVKTCKNFAADTPTKKLTTKRIGAKKAKDYSPYGNLFSKQ